jgi:hypothetical protein
MGFIAGYIISTANIMIWNRKKSILQFDKIEEKKILNPKRVYWTVINPQKTNVWAILMHQYGGRSDYMEKQGKIYYSLGYNLLFFDARSHGISQFVRESTAVRYGWDMIEILKKEQIKSVFLHGVSFGGIGILTSMKTFPKDIVVRTIIVEAICKDIKNIYKYLLQYSPLPYFLYFWMPSFLRFRKRFFDWDGHAMENIIETLSVPIFLIHSELDSLYKPEIHFEANRRAIESNNKVNENKNKSESWLVPGTQHTKMSQHPDWEMRIRKFLENK